VLLFLGFAAFLGSYEGYAQLLGRVDGLPPLPEEFLPSDEPLIDLTKVKRNQTVAEKKLTLAYGRDCPELKWPIKLMLNTKGLVMAAKDFVFVNGRVKLTPFSLAIFGKKKGPAETFPEINTVRSDEAFITFDRPVTGPTEMGGRKIIAGELHGTITMTNNRRTRQTDDDIQVTITQKPLFYLEKDHHVWTKGIVHLLDQQSRPSPTQINAIGMDMFLTTAPAGGDKAKQSAGSKGKQVRNPNPRVENSKRAKNDTITGVERIILHKNVYMYLYVDAKNGFLGGSHDNPPSKGDTAKAKTEPGRGTHLSSQDRPPQKDLVYIHTDGKFVYNLITDLATFDIPANRKEEEYQVQVTRKHEQGGGLGPLYDQLSCAHLELQFHRKAKSDVPVKRDNQSTTTDREIESAHATGKDLQLALDTSNLVVKVAEELIYHSPTATKGAETTIKGKPLRAAKDGNEIQARELWLRSALVKGGPQEAKIKGPGRIDMLDRNSPTERRPVHVIWRDILISNKDGPYDLLTLTGDAAFVDDDHAQELRGQRLMVWLEPADKGAPPKPPLKSSTQASPVATDSSRQRPHRLEAYVDVSLHSPEMNVVQTDHLTVWFKDVPPARSELPSAVVPKSGEGMSPPSTPETSSAPTPGLGKALVSGEGKPGGAMPTTTPRQPINLWGASVVAYVNRVADQNEFSKLVSKGAVHVHQDGRLKDDKGADIKNETLDVTRLSCGAASGIGGSPVDIKGETLELIRTPGSRGLPTTDARYLPPSDHLVVLGDLDNPRKPAELQMGAMKVKGPRVIIDQKDNTAEVKGLGTMKMPSNTTFEGGKPAKPDTILTIHWNTGMFFDGKAAEFDGGVTAYQDHARLKCLTLQVTLDRAISFREGQKGEPAKVEHMVCDKNVFVEDKVYVDGKLEKYNRLKSFELTRDNPAGTTLAPGPGIFYNVQKGLVDSGFDGPAPSQPAASSTAKPAKPEEEMKLTRVEFQDRLWSKNEPNSPLRKVIFYGSVELVNAPTPSPDPEVAINMTIDKDHLPIRGMYISCAKLTMLSKIQPQEPARTGQDKIPPKQPDKTPARQTMIAQDKVHVRTPEFQAYAATVIYEEEKNLVTFKGSPGINGTPGTPATFFQIRGPGLEPKQWKGQTIFYNRLTKQFKVEDGGTIILN
jgi:hypothetical protein